MSQSSVLKILHIGKYYPPFHGGIENVMSDLMEQQEKAGMRVIGLVHQHEKKRALSDETRRCSRVIRVPILGQAVFVPIAPSFPRMLSRLLKQCDTQDILHLHMPNVSCFWTLFSCQARKVPWVVHWHSDVLGASPDWRVKLLYPFYRVFERALLSRAKAIIVTSPGYLETSKPLAAFRNKCQVIPLGISDRDDSAYCENFPVYKTTGDIKLLCIGRLTYYKGHDYLVSAIRMLIDRGEKVELTIVGTGDMEYHLKARVDDEKLGKWVKFAGSVSSEALDTYIRETHLLCLPSIERTEAFGVVLLEAMRAGKACLVSDVEGSGMNWVVEKGVTGFVVEAKNAPAIAEAVTYALRHMEEVQSMGKHGRIRFSQYFTIKKVCEDIASVYANVLGTTHKQTPIVGKEA